MGLRVTTKILVGVLVLLVFAAGSLEASVRKSDGKPGKGKFGIKGGLFGSGMIKYGPKRLSEPTDSIETDESYSVGIFFEYPFYKKLQATISVDVHDLKKDILGLEFSEKFIDFGVGLKFNWIAYDNRLALKPGFILGYALLSEVEAIGLESSNYVTVQAFTELIFYPRGGMGILLELGLLWAPSGGNEQMNITGGPMALMRVGITSLR